MIKCPVCEYPDARFAFPLHDRILGAVSGSFELYECSSCGLLFQRNEGLTEDQLRDFYPSGYWWSGRDTWTSQLEREYRERVLRWDQISFLKRSLPAAQKQTLLDIGCGAGTLVKLANEEGFDAFGLEQSERAVRAASQENGGRIFHGSLQDLIESHRRFDVVVMLHTLEHLLDPLGYLKKIGGVMNRPGHLVVQVPNRASYQARILGSRWYGLDCPRHIFNFTPYALLHLLGRAGFRIQKTRLFSLRDNAPALVSSLFPGLDPMTRRIKTQGESSWLLEGFYFLLVMAAQPLCWLEARLGRGATITVYATLD